jgi:hypothetical protein
MANIGLVLIVVSIVCVAFESGFGALLCVGAAAFMIYLS